MRKDFFRQMEAAVRNMNKQADEKKDTKAEAKPSDIFNEETAKLNAKEFGEGVTCVSGYRITSEDFEGFKAIYSFKDISQIRIKQDAKKKMSPSSVETDTNAKENQKYIAFS